MIVLAPEMLAQVTGGGARVAAQKSDSTARLTLMMQQVIAALNELNTKVHNDPMQKILPMMLAMKKGDPAAMMAAAAGGGGGGEEKKSA